MKTQKCHRNWKRVYLIILNQLQLRNNYFLCVVSIINLHKQEPVEKKSLFGKKSWCLLPKSCDMFQFSDNGTVTVYCAIDRGNKHVSIIILNALHDTTVPRVLQHAFLFYFISYRWNIHSQNYHIDHMALVCRGHMPLVNICFGSIAMQSNWVQLVWIATICDSHANLLRSVVHTVSGAILDEFVKNTDTVTITVLWM